MLRQCPWEGGRWGTSGGVITLLFFYARRSICNALEDRFPTFPARNLTFWPGNIKLEPVMFPQTAATFPLPGSPPSLSSSHAAVKSRKVRERLHGDLDGTRRHRCALCITPAFSTRRSSASQAKVRSLIDAMSLPRQVRSERSPPEPSGSGGSFC